MSKFWGWIKNHLFDGFIFAFIWELVEELMEVGIAFFITWAILRMATKVFAVTLLTQGLKTIGKKFIFPVVLKLTYREGNDKMKLLKNYFDKCLGNKITGTISGIGFAGISYFQTLVPFATRNVWFALITFVLFFNVGVFFGGETLNQIQERLAEATLKKEERSILKEAKSRLAKLEKEATQTETEKLKAEAKAKAEAEKNAKVEKVMAELKAEAEKKIENK